MKTKKNWPTKFFRFRENGQNAFLAPRFKISKNRLNLTLWHIKLKGLTPSLTSKQKKMGFGVMGPLQGPKRGFRGPIGGFNSSKLWNILTVTYQIEGFASLMKIKMEKMGFGTLGPLLAPKMGIWAHWGVPFHKVTKHTYCDTSNYRICLTY